MTGCPMPLYCIAFALIALAAVTARASAARQRGGCGWSWRASLLAIGLRIGGYGVMGLAQGQSRHWWCCSTSDPRHRARLLARSRCWRAIQPSWPCGRAGKCRRPHELVLDALPLSRRPVPDRAWRLYIAVFLVHGLFHRHCGPAEPHRRPQCGNLGTTAVGMALLQLPNLGQKMLPFAILLGGVFTFVQACRAVARTGGHPRGRRLGLGFPAAAAHRGGVHRRLRRHACSHRYRRQDVLGICRARGALCEGTRNPSCRCRSTDCGCAKATSKQQSVIHALRVAQQGEHLAEVAGLPLWRQGSSSPVA